MKKNSDFSIRMKDHRYNDEGIEWRNFHIQVGSYGNGVNMSFSLFVYYKWQKTQKPLKLRIWCNRTVFLYCKNLQNTPIMHDVALGHIWAERAGQVKSGSGYLNFHLRKFGYSIDDCYVLIYTLEKK